MKLTIAGAAGALLLVSLQPCAAKELLVVAAAAVKTAVANVPSKFKAQTGDSVRFVFGTAGEIHNKVVAGDNAAIVILPPKPLADLMKRKLVVKGSRRDLGTVILAAAVRKGAPKPNIATSAAFKAALLKAPSIGIANPATGATSGIYLAKLMTRLGVAKAVKPKMKFFPDGQIAMEAVAAGKIALGLGQSSEIRPVKGVVLAGALPNKLQLRTIYAAGMATKAAKDPAAKRLFALLTGRKESASFKAAGFAVHQ